MRKLAILVFLLLSANGFTQDLIHSRQTSFYTYIFRLSPSEAGKLYSGGTHKVDESYFHTLVDSFRTDSTYREVLPEGHYLRVYTSKNKVKFDVTSVQDFDIRILKNNTDLCVRVFDSGGKIIPDAKVRVGLKHLKYDKRTSTYIDRKSGRHGLLKVTVDGFTAYYDLNREYPVTAFKRTIRKVVYGVPLKYVWMPVEFVVMLPVDGVRSLIHMYPRGKIYKTIYFFRNPFYAFRNFNSRSHSIGYMVFNKPRYLPGDTVKFKTYILNKHGRPLNEPLTATLYTNRRSIVLDTLVPYRKGGYEFSFFLHDSLGLTLDRNYSVYLRNKNGRNTISRSFRYEDYELFSTKLELRSNKETFYRGEDCVLYVKGTDENGLNILGGKLHVTVYPSEIEKFIDNRVFIQDTLMDFNLPLASENETEILIPDSVFPNVNMSLVVKVTLQTPEFENVTESQGVDFIHSEKKIDFTTDKDSLTIFYSENGKIISREGIIYGVDRFGNVQEVMSGNLPLKIAITPYFSNYRVISGDAEGNVDVAGEPSLITCYSDRTADSIKIFVNNPRNLPFTYFIYKKNNEKKRGYTDSLNLAVKAASKKDYYLSVQYLWAGVMHTDDYKIPLEDKRLQITVEEPKLVYPSQKIKIELTVTDQNGNPAAGTDITAFSFTGKFKEQGPEIPYFGKYRKNKLVLNNFSVSDHNIPNRSALNLDYKEWCILAGIDSIEYYKFIYPGKEIYTNDYVPDDSLTQFAPFIVSGGNIIPVHVVYFDHRPVYFSWSTNSRPYSFPAAAGYHNIQIRTSDASYFIDSVFFKPGMKKIISLGDSIDSKHVKRAKMKSSLSKNEKSLLYRYIFPYRDNFKNKYAFIKQGDNVQLLKGGNYYRQTCLAGPVKGTLVDFEMIDGFHTKFVHEPFFEYDFSPGLLKMRSMDPKRNYPDNLLAYYDRADLDDEIMTGEKVRSEWQQYLDNKRKSTARYQNPNHTNITNGRLRVILNPDSPGSAEPPLNIILQNKGDQDFLRVYPGNVVDIENLVPGIYRLIFFYPNSKYFIADTLRVIANGLSYFRIKPPETLKRDSFSVYVSHLIEEKIFVKDPYGSLERTENNTINKKYQEQYWYQGNEEIIEGYVYDENGEAVPGVTVVIKGTTTGTVTNMEGYYYLKIPNRFVTLQFSFIGFEQVEQNVDGSDFLNVTMKSSNLALDEVVVIGYGAGKKESLTAAVSADQTTALLNPELSSSLSGALQGRVAGVEISKSTGVPGVSLRISVRGVGTTDFNGTPLYIIDGMIFNGDIQSLDPNLITGIQILKGEEATSVYGSRGSAGVVIISTGGAFKPLKPLSNSVTGEDEAFYEAAFSGKSIRDNFSDYAFWKPKLLTDEDGKASFEITFPDDITSWRTFYYAMNDNKQTGKREGLIRSYKPLMAKISSPRFLVEGDTSYAIGKVLNYTSDSMNVYSTFELNDKTVFSHSNHLVRMFIDTLTIHAVNSDSVNMKYYIERQDNYTDGEKRKIPVYPAGMNETEGDFIVLDTDTSLSLNPDSLTGEFTIHARADILDVVEEELFNLINYRYTCNEQLASKLKALIMEERIRKFTGDKFKHKREAERIIKLLIRNECEQGLWGWWRSSKKPGIWISLHVLEALSEAGQNGYVVNLDKNRMTGLLLWYYDNIKSTDDKIRLLRLLKMLDARLDYEKYIDAIEKSMSSNFYRELLLTELRQFCALPQSLKYIDKYRNETMFGNVYYSGKTSACDLFRNDIQSTLAVYRIFRNDTTPDRVNELNRMRNYLLEARNNRGWLNTFESSCILETILPDLLNSERKPAKPSLSFTGTADYEVKEFPFDTTISVGGPLQVVKKGDYPVYLTFYRRNWNKSPIEKKTDFEITTNFDNAGDRNILEAGKEVMLNVNLEVLKDADYVMINVPIPAGCSYADKENYYRHEIHREYFRNETAIFCEQLKKGHYEFQIKLLPRYTGKYNLNPARVELMYFPTFNANNKAKRVIIE